jgi:TonB family protein
MNRLQKKCVIATGGIHLLLLLVLVFGSAFFTPRPKPDDTQLLDVIPANLIDAAFNSGVRNATPPAPAPVVVPPPQPAPPTPAIQPPPPVPKPVAPPPTLVERVEKYFKPEPVKPMPDLTPVEKPAKNQPHKIEPNLTPTIRTAPNNSVSKPQPNSRAIDKVIANLKKNLSPGTTIDMPGDSTVAYANYASVVKSIYDRAWTLPDSIANDDENVKVTVTIASDGTVISAHVIERAGDAPVDNSVQRTLDRVTFIAPFPEGATEKERTYTINFNPKAKRTLE